MHPTTPGALQSAELIADINRQLNAVLGDYIRENANGETPPPTPAPATAPSRRARGDSPIVVLTPESRKASARRRLFSEAPAPAPRSI